MLAESSDKLGAARSWISGNDFVMIHLDLVDALDGSYDAAALLNRIAFRAGDGWWTATRADFMAELRMTEHRVKTALQLLRDRSMITSKRVSAFDPTLQWRIVYRHEVDGDERRHEAEPPADTVPESHAVTSPLEELEELPPSPPAQLVLVGDADVEPVDTIAAEFDGFWKHWPDKRGRKAALQAYRRARKRAELEVIAAGVRTHVPVFAAKIAAGDRQFVPHAATWLNQDRWADPPPAMPRAADPYGAVDNPALLAQSSSYGDPYAGLAGTQPATYSIGGSS